MKRYRRTRVTQRQETPSDPLRDRLAALLRGSPVELVISYKSKHGRASREVNLLVLLAPGKYYGMLGNLVVVSVVGKGSCVVHLDSGKGVAGLAKAGFPMVLAKALVEQLKTLYGESKDGNS